MSANEQDEILRALAALPEPTQNAAARSTTLSLTLRALATSEARVTDADVDAVHAVDVGNGSGRSHRSRHSMIARWLTRERFVPAVLCLAGALYTHGAIRNLASVFAPEPASLVHAARAAAARGSLRPVVVEPRRPTREIADVRDQTIAGGCRRRFTLEWSRRRTA